MDVWWMETQPPAVQTSAIQQMIAPAVAHVVIVILDHVLHIGIQNGLDNLSAATALSSNNAFFATMCCWELCFQTSCFQRHPHMA